MHIHTATIVDDITNYKLVFMIVILEEPHSDLMNVSAQNVSFMREIYYLVKNTCHVPQLSKE